MTDPSLSSQEPETDPQRLTDLLLALDAVQYALRRLQVHYDGVAAIEFVSPEAREALEGRLSEIYVNIPRLVVSSIAERLNITGWTGTDADLAQEIWYANDLDVQGDLAHSEALLFGRSYAWVWAGQDGPRVSIESARQTAVLADPGTREITSAVKRWHVSSGLGVGSTEAVLLLPDRIERWASTLGAEIGGFSPVDVQPNPLGVVPVAQFTNQGRLLNSWGYRGIDELSYPSRLLMGSGVYSEIDDVIPLSSALSKALFDLMCTLEATGRPRRYASGIELVEKPRLDHQGQPVLDTDGNPIIDTVNPLAQEASRTWISENDTAKFGQLDAADLKGFTDAVNVIVQQILAVTALSPSYLGVLTSQPPSADALRASESSLIARVEQKQKMFGKSWERTLQLAIAVQTGRDPRTVDAKPVWRPADQSSDAQAADATVKLYQTGLLPRSAALRKLGYSDQEIDAIRADTSDDVAAEKKGDPMAAYLSGQNPHLQ
jgi:hypothetical protein